MFKDDFFGKNGRPALSVCSAGNCSRNGDECAAVAEQLTKNTPSHFREMFPIKIVHIPLSVSAVGVAE